jgi:tight adherence protein C
MMSKIGDYPAFISASAFLATFLLLMAIWVYFRQRARKRELTQKIRYEGGNPEEFVSESLLAKPYGAGQSRIMSFLGSLGERVVSDKSTDVPRIKIKFLKAGLRWTKVPAVFWGAKCSLAMCFPVSFLLFRVSILSLFDPSAIAAICISLAVLGFYIPDMWLRRKIAKRKNKLLVGFPDALDLLVVCVEAGMGLDAAINRVVKEIELSNKTMSEEFNLLNLELRAGKSRRDALRNLAMRTDLEDVNSLVTLLVQADKFGTSVTRTLKVYSDNLRTKRFQRAEEIAGKLPIKLIFPLVLFIFPSFFITLLGPAAIRIYQVFLSS